MSPISILRFLRTRSLFESAVVGLWISVLSGVAFGAAGDLDVTFDPGAGANPRGVVSLLEQADGKILIGGNFETYGSLTRRSIARANASGSVDNSFDPGTGLDRAARSLEEQTDGKILLLGDFTTCNGFNRYCIARLSSNGSVDTAYNPGVRYSAGSILLSSALQADGKLLVGGSALFTFAGDPLPVVERYNPDGSLDTEFVMTTSTNNGLASEILLQPDGKIIVAGTFQNAGVSQNSIRRLNSDGSLDTSFFSGATEVTGNIEDAVLQPDGKIVIVGSFISYRGTPRNRIARVNADGTLDTTFDPGSGVQINGQTGGNLVSVALQADGRLVIAGSFDRYNGEPRLFLTRVNDNGSLDTTFNTGTGPDDVVITMGMQADGKILIGGFFFNYNGVRRDSIARLSSGQLSKQIRFTAATRSAAEGESLELLVRRGQGSTGAVVVPFAVSGSATSADFTITSPTNGQIEFATGEYEKTIAISLAGDTTEDSEETIVVTLQSPFGDATVGNPSATTITITESLLVANRPDALIGFRNGTLLGNDIYNGKGTGQTISAKIDRGDSKSCLIYVENDGRFTKSIRVKGSTGFSKMPVTYSQAGRNVTRSIAEGTFQFKDLAPGAGKFLKVTVEVKEGARADETTALYFNVISATDPTEKDRVVFKVRPQ